MFRTTFLELYAPGSGSAVGVPDRYTPSCLMVAETDRAMLCAPHVRIRTQSSSLVPKTTQLVPCVLAWTITHPKEPWITSGEAEVRVRYLAWTRQL